nr:WIAG-tail domain [Paenibacillus turicensis]
MGAVQSEHLAARSVCGYHLAEQVIDESHIQPGSISSVQLKETPVHTLKGKPALQQFGMVPFLHQNTAVASELVIQFEQPFEHSQYVLVAMSNHPSYYVTLKEQSTHSATLTLSRINTFHIEGNGFGFISWIAIGATSDK